MTCQIAVAGNGTPAGCRVDTGGEMVGAGFARMAANDPAHARAVFDSVLDNTPDPVARRDIARGMAQSMQQETMHQLCETPDGRAMLERAHGELQADPSEWASAAIDSTLKSANLKGTAEFKGLDPQSRQRVPDRIDTQWADPSAVDSAVALAKSQGFQAATQATRKEMLSSLQQTSAISSLSTAQGTAKQKAPERNKPDTEAKRKHALAEFEKHHLRHWHREWKYIFDPGSQTWSVMAK